MSILRHFLFFFIVSSLVTYPNPRRRHSLMPLEARLRRRERKL